MAFEFYDYDQIISILRDEFDSNGFRVGSAMDVEELMENKQAFKGTSFFVIPRSYGTSKNSAKYTVGDSFSLLTVVKSFNDRNTFIGYRAVMGLRQRAIDAILAYPLTVGDHTIVLSGGKTRGVSRTHLWLEDIFDVVYQTGV